MFFFAFPLDLSVQLQTNSCEICLHATVTLKHQKTKERPSSNEMTWTVGVCVCTLAGIAAVSVICRKNHHPAWLCSYYFLFVWLLLTRLNFLSLFSIPKPRSTRLCSFLLLHSAEKQASITRGKADCVYSTVWDLNKNNKCTLPGDSIRYMHTVHEVLPRS